MSFFKFYYTKSNILHTSSCELLNMSHFGALLFFIVALIAQFIFWYTSGFLLRLSGTLLFIALFFQILKYYIVYTQEYIKFKETV